MIGLLNTAPMGETCLWTNVASGWWPNRVSCLVHWVCRKVAVLTKRGKRRDKSNYPKTIRRKPFNCGLHAFRQTCIHILSIYMYIHCWDKCCGSSIADWWYLYKYSGGQHSPGSGCGFRKITGPGQQCSLIFRHGDPTTHPDKVRSHI